MKQFFSIVLSSCFSFAAIAQVPVGVPIANTPVITAVASLSPGLNVISIIRNGSFTKFDNVETALTNSVSGDTVIVPAGIYTTTNGWFIPNGVKLIGIGMPTLINYNTNNPLPYAIWTSPNTWVQNFYISNTVSGSSGAKQVCIGASTLQQAVDFTNITLVNIVGEGFSDGLFYKSSKNVGLREYNTVFRAQWDARVIVADSGATASRVDWELNNCVGIIYTNQAVGIGYTHCFGVDEIVDVFKDFSVIVNGGYFVSTNNGYGYCGAFLDTGDSNPYPGTVTITGATFDSDGTPLYLGAWSGKSLYMSGCTFKRNSKIIQDDANLIGNSGLVQGNSSAGAAYPNGYVIVDQWGGPNTSPTWTNIFNSDGSIGIGETNKVGIGSLIYRQVYSKTNSGSGTFINMQRRDHLLQTNANFAFRGIQNILQGISQTEITWVTNTGASTIAFTAPAGTLTNGIWLCTNAGMTKIIWDIYENRFTNAYAQPIR